MVDKSKQEVSRRVVEPQPVSVSAKGKPFPDEQSVAKKRDQIEVIDHSTLARSQYKTKKLTTGE